MSSDDFQLRTIREAISQDWMTLASNNISAEQRKAVREHLEMNVSALRDLVQRSRLAKQSAKLRGVSASLNKLSSDEDPQ